MGVIEPAVHTQDEYFSTIFVRKKKQRPKPHIEKHHFEMDTLLSAVRLMTPNCFMASVDLKVVYYAVPILLKDTYNIIDFTGRVVSINTHVYQMGFHPPLGVLLSY